LARFERVAHLRACPLPGGSSASGEPRRSAFGLLHEAFGAAVVDMVDLAPVAAFTRAERRVLLQMIERGVQAPRTSSMGRLFDGVAALASLRQRVHFEGQAAMELEFAVDRTTPAEPYSMELHDGDGAACIDWAPMIHEIVADIRNRVSRARIAARFHETLIGMILAVARREALTRVVLSGGCFQNALLLEGAVRRLRAAGHEVYWPRRVPPNDGGISLGQAVVAGATLRAREHSPCA
jgi:hydrogenase maturation protein HypF